ncbi:AlpA family phage regulatory protein [Rhizobium sp. Root1220]|uniref:helix-turn-helix transcriptional regulator n=1 Tax=Rhizobium sp. Root1220 TaxID=1736432 RepID=UPI0006F41ABC|nr:AlpA family phage regulatory protein [Rhizobium sp. Root1220]KQV73019.1 hypothetical protein ASC90_06290 [Rhizobium sp. Root1220]
MSENTILTRDQLCAMLNISDTSRQRLEKSDPNFPPKIKIGVRRVAYLRDDAYAWLLQQREDASKRRYVA